MPRGITVCVGPHYDETAIPVGGQFRKLLGPCGDLVDLKLITNLVSTAEKPLAGQVTTGIALGVRVPGHVESGNRIDDGRGVSDPGGGGVDQDF